MAGKCGRLGGQRIVRPSHGRVAACRSASMPASAIEREAAGGPLQQLAATVSRCCRTSDMMYPLRSVDKQEFVARKQGPSETAAHALSDAIRSAGHRIGQFTRDTRQELSRLLAFVRIAAAATERLLEASAIR